MKQQCILYEMQITDLPFSLYSTFVIEARHGFNKVRSYFLIFPFICYQLVRNMFEIWQLAVFDSTEVTELMSLLSSFSRYFCTDNLRFLLLHTLQQTIWLYIRDMIKGILLSMVLGPPIVAAIIYIVQVTLLFYCLKVI